MEAEQPAELIALQPTVEGMRERIDQCRGCDLYRNATQGVFGQGSAAARILFVGEQPGDEEDRKGAPFVGPAGRLLDRALVEAGIRREDAYVTNAVKHFKFEERGKRRIHKKPNRAEISACRPWLAAEIATIQPVVLVCLGATAAQALLGGAFRLTQHRGEFFAHEWAPHVIATLHPSAILRAPDEEQRQAWYESLVADLVAVRQLLESGSR